MNARWFLSFELTLLSVAALLACAPAARAQSGDDEAAAKQSVPADQPVLEKRAPRYQLRSSDVLKISFPITPEFDQTVTVQPDGYITLRGAGDLYVEELSVPQVIEAIQRAYSKVLHDPIIDVLLTDFEKPYFIAGGQVSKPGKYDLRGDTTVAEAVEIAGGFTDKSKHSNVVIYRRQPNGWLKVSQLDMKKMLSRNDLTEDVHLHPGDLIYVPQNGLSKIKSFIPSTGLGMSIPVM
jgi:protein involved in polysaccharide export with SLBB domain